MIKNATNSSSFGNSVTSILNKLKKIVKRSNIKLPSLVLVTVAVTLTIGIVVFNNRNLPNNVNSGSGVLGARKGGLDRVPNPQPLPKRTITTSSILKNTIKVADAPTNDNWPGQNINSALPIGVAGNTTESTVETSEPDPNGFTPASTVWYSWTSDFDGALNVNTCDANFESELQIYTGTSLSDLALHSLVSDPGCMGNGSQKKFNVTNGTTYYFQVLGRNSAVGTFTLIMRAVGSAPANDNWPGQELTDALPISISGTTLDSTIQNGENFNSDDQHTVWYQWTSTVTGVVKFETCGSEFDALAEPYTGGSSVSTISYVNYWSGYCTGPGLKATFDAVSGTVYYFQISSLTDNHTVGNFNFTISYDAPTPTPTATPATGPLADGSRFCENHNGIALTAPTLTEGTLQDKWLQCRTWCEANMSASDGSELCQFNGGVDQCWTVFKPASAGGLDDCNWIQSGPPPFGSYLGQVFTTPSPTPTATPAESPTPTPTATPTPEVPANDEFVNATTINVGDNLTTNTTLATTEADPVANEITKSVWYKFIPSETSSYQVDLCNSAIALTKLFVFEDNALTGNYQDLSRIKDNTVNNAVCSTQSAVTFNAESGKTYYFEVGTAGTDEPGNVTVHLTKTTTPTDVNLAQVGSERSPIFTADQDGNAFDVMTNGLLDSAQSWTNSTKSDDYWGIGFGQMYDMNRVVYTTGNIFSDGGWFGNDIQPLKVMVRQFGVWVDVTNVHVSPEYPYNNSAGPHNSYTFTFDTIRGDAVWVWGVPAEAVPGLQFTTIGEFEVYDDTPVSPTPTPTASPSPTPAVNRAVGGTVAACQEGFPSEWGPGGMATAAFDQDVNTKWFAATTPSCIVYHFANDEAYVINSYSMTSADDAPERDPVGWLLKGSNDNSNWTVLDTQANQGFAGRLTKSTYSFTNTNAYKYYVLDYVNPAVEGNYVQIAEIELFGELGTPTSPSPTPSPTPVSEVNRATGGTATARGSNPDEPGQIPGAAFDGNNMTKWLDFSGENSSWLKYQFPGDNAYAINKYTITSGEDAPERDPVSWELKGSNDDTNWTTLDRQSKQSFADRSTTNTYQFTDLSNMYPLAQYHFNDNTADSIVVDSIGDKTATYVGGTDSLTNAHTTAGKVNKALNFGGNDYVSLPSNFDWSAFTNGFSLSVWVKPTNVAGYQRIFDFGNGESSDNILLFRSGDTQDLTYKVYHGGDSTEIALPGALTQDEWQNFTITQNLNGVTHIYKNGVLIGNDTILYPSNVARTYNYIGKSNWPGDALFQGSIDELQFFNKELDSSDISNLYNLTNSNSYKYYLLDNLSIATPNVDGIIQISEVGLYSPENNPTPTATPSPTPTATATPSPTPTPAVPENDTYPTATTILVNDSLVVDTTSANTEDLPYAGEIQHSVWYKFVPETQGNYLVDLCGSALSDTKLFVWRKYPGETRDYLDLVRMADNIQNTDVCSTQSAIAFNDRTRSTYYFEVGTYNDLPAGSITIHLTQTASLGVDDAPVITINPRADAERVETIQPTFTGSITDPDGIVGAEYLFFPGEQIYPQYGIGGLDDQNWAPLTPDGGTWGTNNTFTVSPIAGSGLHGTVDPSQTSRTEWIEGKQFLYIRAWDSHYNPSTPETKADTLAHKSLYDNYGWIYYYGYGSDHLMAVYRVFVNALDKTAPDIISSSIVPNPTTDSSPSIHGYVRDVTTDKTSNITNIQYKLDDGTWTDVSPYNKVAFNSPNEEFNIQLSNVAIGSHTLIVRAIDASGNDTNDQSKNFVDTFAVQVQTPSAAELISKIEDFSTRNMDDQYNTTGIWGNGYARARQSIQFDQSLDYSAFTSAEMGYLYGNRGVGVFPAADTDHLWVSLNDNSFAYYNKVSKSVTKYTTLRDGVNGNPGINMRPSSIKEFTSESKRFLAIDYGYNAAVVFYDLNNTAENPADDSFVTLESKFGTEGRIAIHNLNTSGSSVILEGVNDPTGVPQVTRVDTHGTIMDTSDDTITNWNEASGMQHRDVTAPPLTNMAINSINVTGLLFDNSKGYFLATNYEGGLNVCSTSSYTCSFNPDPVYGIFTIVKDLVNSNLYWLGGNQGLYLYDTKGTLTTSDDQITLVRDRTTHLAGDWVSGVSVFPGTNPVGEEVFMFTNTGRIRILETNNTPTDLQDDTDYVYSLPTNLYRNPFGVSAYFASKDHTWIFMPGTGLFNVSITRGFEDNNVIEVLPSPPQGKLEVNHIKFNAVIGSNLTAQVVDNNSLQSSLTKSINAAGGQSLVDYFVSNNNGITWYPITIGGQVNFPTSDYQLRFKAILHPRNGVTPVLTNVNLSYALYPDDPAIDPNLALQYPTEASTGQTFNGDAIFLDELGYTPNWNGQVSLELVEANNTSRPSTCISYPSTLAVVNGEVQFDSTAVCPGEFIFKGQTVDGQITTVGHAIAVSIPTTPIPTPTSTPIVGDTGCDINPYQAACQVEVKISNVRINNPADTTLQVCWDTNIDTIGMVSYGLKSVNTLTNSSDLETTYKRIDHCVTLTNINKSVDYIYQIKATSYAGKFDTYDGDLAKSKDETAGDYTSCIALQDKDVTINAQSQVSLYFTTPSEMTCTTKYGNVTTKDANTLTTGPSNSHNPILEIAKTNGKSDIYYSISCIPTITTTATGECKTNGVVTQGKFYKTPVAVIDNTTVGNLLTGTTMVGALALGIFTSVGYPQWLLYSILIIKRKKKVNPWGVVYNTDNHTPLAFTPVKLYRKSDNKLLVQTISDLQGRYNIVADQGNYTVVVDDVNFHRFSKAMEITSKEQAIILDIALTPNKDRKASFKLQEKIKSFWGKLYTVIVVLGFCLSVIALFLNPVWLNVVVFIAYIVQGYILLRVVYPKTWGIVYTGSPDNRLKGAFVRILDAKEGVQVDVQITDEKGRFYFWGEKNKSYLLKVDMTGYELSDKYKSSMVATQSGESFLKCQYTQGNNLDLELEKK